MELRSNKMRWAVLAAVPAMALAACTSEAEPTETSTSTASATHTPVEITLAHSYTDAQPQALCGADVIKEEAEAAGVGLTIEIFGNSQLGGDADRIASVVSGDIDMDIQGASALGAVYEPISVMDTAFVFSDQAHIDRFMASDESSVLVQGFYDETGVTTLGVWSVGARQFTANKPIRTPEDLEGVRMRFPGSPQYLLNAQALGAEATEVAYEELYLALQQGTVEGQENPITNIVAKSMFEVQDYISMSAHQLNTNLVIIGGVWDTLDADQQAALQSAVNEAVASVADCVAAEEKAQLDAWKADGTWKGGIIEDVDRDAFAAKAEEFFKNEYTGAKLEVYEAIRATA